MERGVGVAIGSYTLWGFSPLYWTLLAHVGALEILGHRIAWSAVFMLAIVATGPARRQLQRLTLRDWIHITLAATFVAINWGTYIWAVTHGHTIDASLGYFLHPVVAVALGFFFLKERLRPLQTVALGIAIGGVVVVSLDGSGFPFVAIILASSFGLYSLLKSVITASATVSLTGESLVLLVPALLYVVVIEWSGTGHFVGGSFSTMSLLVLSGPLTAIPLLLFGAAARTLRLSTIGILQFINPVIQFLLGRFWFGEHMSTTRWVGVAAIIAAVVIFSLPSRKRPRPATVEP